MTKQTILTEIVKRALTETVIHIGQLTKQQVRELDKAVKAGVLSKGKGGPFPMLKTMWAVPAFDFAADREMAHREMQVCAAFDRIRLGNRVPTEWRNSLSNWQEIRNA